MAKLCLSNSSVCGLNSLPDPPEHFVNTGSLGTLDGGVGGLGLLTPPSQAGDTSSFRALRPLWCLGVLNIGSSLTLGCGKESGSSETESPSLLRTAMLRAVSSACNLSQAARIWASLSALSFSQILACLLRSLRLSSLCWLLVRKNKTQSHFN